MLRRVQSEVTELNWTDSAGRAHWSLADTSSIYTTNAVRRCLL